MRLWCRLHGELGFGGRQDGRWVCGLGVMPGDVVSLVIGARIELLLGGETVEAEQRYGLNWVDEVAGGFA
ncbi:hypothetical protein M0R45_019768 [Rubus argutus]|uniref:Uncharacterized protein n=1 Tax=Rubus argutus TaxID=59490 RepID=A0AAW1X9K5_RUBAR